MIVVIAILQQREKAWANTGMARAARIKQWTLRETNGGGPQRSQELSVATRFLFDVNFAIEAYGTDQAGNYSALNGGDSTSSSAPFQLILDQGYKNDASVDLMVTADSNSYCVTAEHPLLPVTHEWQTATFSSAGGAPDEANIC